MENIKLNNNHELKQSIFRILFTAFIFIYLLFNNASKAEISFVTSYVLVGVASFLFLSSNKLTSKTYRWLSLVSDVTAVSIGLYLTGASGAIFLGVYLWLITGYGLRYGRKMLFGAYFLCIFGFILAISFNNYWHGHTEMVAGFLVTLVLIPLHVNNLLSKLDKAIKNAEQASKVKSDFLSHISHEIRTPLNGVIGASYLLNQTNLNYEQKELTTIIVNSSSTVTDIISNVLDLSAIESGKVVLNPSKVNLNSFSQDIILILSSQAKFKNIEIIYECSVGENVDVLVDALRLKQVLINLLANSIKFTETGFVKLKLELVGDAEKSVNILFSVIDTGIGIQESSITKIYDSFTQADGGIKEKFGGTGLGLTISNNLVRLMGGKLDVESEYGVGSTFKFTLDLPVVVKQKVNAEGESESLISPALTHVHAKLLVVEDNQINSLIINKALTQHGHTVALAETGESAFDLLENNEFDVILLDNNLPDYIGVNFIKTYHALTIGLKQSPIIILTADATVDERDKLISAGAHAYLTKPLDMNLVLNTIDHLVNNKEGKPRFTAEIIPINRKLQTINVKPEYIDLEHLKGLSALERNDQFMLNLIENFIVDTDMRIQSLKDKIESGNYNNIRFITHTLEGSSASIGAVELSRLASELHDLTPSTDNQIRARVYEQLVDAFRCTKIELINYIEMKQEKK